MCDPYIVYSVMKFPSKPGFSEDANVDILLIQEFGNCIPCSWFCDRSAVIGHHVEVQQVETSERLC